MNTYKEIIKNLEEAFSKFDTLYTEKQVTYYVEKSNAIKEYYDNLPKERNGAWVRGSYSYDAVCQIAGGKGMYEKLQHSNLNAITLMATKDAKAVIKARNAKMAKKLEDAGITKVLKSNLELHSDGFHGYYNVETDNGNKVIRIETIIAGGYNIQRLHYRTLVKVA